MRTLQTIVENLRDTIGTDLARYVIGDQDSAPVSDDLTITAEDVLNILARAKARQTKELSGSAEQSA
jgi:hypothetical protein